MQSQSTQLNNQIKLFLEGKLNYNVGLSLFMRVSTDTATIIKLFGAPTEEKETLLFQKLNQYYEIEHQLGQSQPASVSNASENYSSTSTPSSLSENNLRRPVDFRYSTNPVVPSSDSIKDKLLTERKVLYRNRTVLGDQLFTAVSDANRHSIAKEIMKTTKEIDLINSQLRKVENGLIPEKFIQQSITAEQFVKIKNCQQYINNFKRKLKTETDPGERERFQKLLEKHESNLQKLING